LFSVERNTRTTLGRVVGRLASWLEDVRLTQIVALLVALTVVAPQGLQPACANVKFLSSLKTELIPFEASVQSRHLLTLQVNEARLSQNRVSLGLAATLFTVPPIRHDRPLVASTNYSHRLAAHTLALLRAPPLV
jgi:hypothetical protein